LWKKPRRRKQKNLAGQGADDSSQDIQGQAAQVLAAIDRLLEEHGSDKTKILQCLIYLSDMSLFGQMNAVWDAWCRRAVRRLGRPWKRGLPHRKNSSRSW